MDSHEEKLQNMIKASRMEAARDEADRMARTISERKREETRLGQSLGKMVGIEGGNSNNNGFGQNESDLSPYGRSVGSNNNSNSSMGGYSDNNGNEQVFVLYLCLYLCLCLTFMAVFVSYR